MFRLISSELESRIHSLRTSWDVPGLSISIVSKHGEWKTQYITSGTRGKTLVTPDTTWCIASNSKLFLALALGMLLEERGLSWEAKVADLLHWSLLDKYTESHLTLTDLLSMQSGLPRHDFGRFRDATAASALQQLAHFKPSTEIRKTWQYSNYHYNICLLLFDSYTRFVQERIFDPLGMSATYDFREAVRGELSESFVRKGGDLEACKRARDNKEGYSRTCFGTPYPAGYWNDGHSNLGMAGAGGLVMSGRDMAKWIQECLEPKVIPSSIFEIVNKPRSVVDKPAHPETSANVYGMGVWTFSYRGYQVIQHDGGLPGQLTYFLRIPEKQFGLFLATNDESLGPFIGPAIVYMILDEMLDLPPIDWAERLFPGALKYAIKRMGAEDIPPNPRPSSDITGIYTDAAYGTLDIQNNIAYVERVFASQIKFTPVDGPIWQWRTCRLYGDLESSAEKGLCVFTPKGLGLYGIWGEGPAVETSKSDEENPENAEVWFVKQ